MPKIDLSPLNGLDRKNPEHQDWIQRQKDAGIVNRNTRPSELNQLYRNKQFIDKFGLDTFKQITDPTIREGMYRRSVYVDNLEANYHPFTNLSKAKNADGTYNFYDENGNSLIDPDKGLGEDYFKFLEAADEQAFEDLFGSYYRDRYQSILDVQKQLEEDTKKQSKGNYGYNPMAMSSYVSPYAIPNVIESISGTNPAVEKKVKQSKATIERIFSDLNDRITKGAADQIDRTYAQYYSPEKKSGELVKKEWLDAITATDNNPGFLYGAHYNDRGEAIDSSMEEFSEEDMRRWLAKRDVYFQLFSPETAHKLLNVEAQKYISSHTGAWDSFFNNTSNIIAGTIAYAGQLTNSVRRLVTGIPWRDGEVFITPNGEIVSLDAPNIIYKNGKPYLYEYNGEDVPLSKQVISAEALDNMGYDPRGNKRWRIFDVNYWNNVEEYGTLDPEAQKRWEKYGTTYTASSLAPGESPSLFWETAAMTKFIIVDGALMGGANLGITLGTKLMANGASIIANTGKALTAVSKAGTRVLPFVSANAIAESYETSLYKEMYQQNIYNVENEIQSKHRDLIHEYYASDAAFKKKVDTKVEQETRERLSKVLEEFEGDKTSARISDIEKIVRGQVFQAVMEDEIAKSIEEYKNSDGYGDDIATAMNNASKAAVLSYWTEFGKYAIINTIGYRNWIYKNRAVKNPGLRSEANQITSKIQSGREVLNYTSTKLNSWLDSSKEVGKIAGRQFWGGAWTNFTDEMQSEASRSYNESAMSYYLQGKFHPEAINDTYGSLEAAGAYLTGLLSGAFKENTWRAGLVGGLGSIFSIAPNFTEYASSDFKERYEKATEGEKLSMLISNSILSEYYAKKALLRNVEATTKAVNKILEDDKVYKYASELAAINKAIDLSNSEEETTILESLKAARLAELYTLFQTDEVFAAVASKSKTLSDIFETIEDLSNVNKLSKDKKDKYLRHYYQENKSKVRSDEEDQQALQKMQERVQKFKQVQKRYVEIVNNIKEYEKETGEKLPEKVKSELVFKNILVRTLDDSVNKLEQEISGAASPKLESNTRAYGNKRAQIQRVKEYKANAESAQKKIEENRKKLEKAKKDLDDYYNEGGPDTAKDPKKLRELEGKVDAINTDIAYFESLLSDLNKSIDATEKYITSLDSTEESILSADEILTLSPMDRAFMLDKDNKEMYSIEQQAEIDKARQRLIDKDPALLNKVMESANFHQKNTTAKKVMQMMRENPKAAAFLLDIEESKRRTNAFAASKLTIAKSIKGMIDAIYQSGKSAGKSNEVIFKVLSRQLKQLNSVYLDTVLDLLHEDGITLYDDLIKNLEEYSKLEEAKDNFISDAVLTGIVKDTDEVMIENLEAAIDYLQEQGIDPYSDEAVDKLSEMKEDGEGNKYSPFERYLQERQKEEEGIEDGFIAEEVGKVIQTYSDALQASKALAEDVERHGREIKVTPGVEGDAVIEIVTEDSEKVEGGEAPKNVTNTAERYLEKVKTFINKFISNWEGIGSNGKIQKLSAQELEEFNKVIEGLTSDKTSDLESIQTALDSAAFNIETNSEDVSRVAEALRAASSKLAFEDQKILNEIRREDEESRRSSTVSTDSGSTLSGQFKPENNTGNEADEGPTKPNANGSRINSLSLSKILKNNPNGDLAKYLKEHKVLEYIESGKLAPNTPVYFMVDDRLTAAVKSSMDEAAKENSTKKKYSDDAMPLIAVVEDANGDITIGNKKYQVIGIMPASYATSSGSAHLANIRSRYTSSKGRGDRTILKSKGKRLQGRLQSFPKAHAVEGIVGNHPNTSIQEVLDETVTADELNQLRGLSHSEKIKHPVYLKMREKFLNNLERVKGTDDFGKGYAIAAYKQSTIRGEEKRNRYVFVKDPRKTVSPHTGKAFTEVLELGSDEEVINFNSRTRGVSKVIEEVIKNLGKEHRRFEFERNKYGKLVLKDKEQTEEYRKFRAWVTGEIFRWLDYSGGQLIIEPTSESGDSYDIYYREGTPALVTITAESNPQSAAAQFIRKSFMDSWGRQEEGAEVSLIKWQVDLTDTFLSPFEGDLTIKADSERWQDAVDDDLFEMALPSLDYEIDHLEITSPFTSEGQPIETPPTIANEDNASSSPRGAVRVGRNRRGEIDSETGAPLNKEASEGNKRTNQTPSLVSQIIEQIKENSKKFKINGNNRYENIEDGEEFFRVTSIIEDYIDENLEKAKQKLKDIQDGKEEGDVNAAEQKVRELEEQQENNRNTSTEIGTGIDVFVRDFFENPKDMLKKTPEALQKKYSNMTGKYAVQLMQQLDAMRRKGIFKGKKVLSSGVTVSGTIEVNGKKINVAGTLDLLLYDENTGKVVIVDMKTHLANSVSSKKKKWSQQLSLYSKLLNKQYGLDVVGLYIMPIKVAYTYGAKYEKSTTKENQLLSGNGNNYVGANPTLGALIPRDYLEPATFLSTENSQGLREALAEVSKGEEAVEATKESPKEEVKIGEDDNDYKIVAGIKVKKKKGPNRFGFTPEQQAKAQRAKAEREAAENKEPSVESPVEDLYPYEMYEKLDGVEFTEEQWKEMPNEEKKRALDCLRLL